MMNSRISITFSLVSFTAKWFASAVIFGLTTPPSDVLLMESWSPRMGVKAVNADCTMEL